MKRATTWALAVVTAMTVMACAGTPMEQANELIETYEASMLYMGESFNEYLTASEATYEGMSTVDCGRRQRASGLTMRDRMRYSGEDGTRMRQLEAEIQNAGTACHNAQRSVQRQLRDLQAMRGNITEEEIQKCGNRLRVEMGRIDQESIGMLLANAESQEAAWARLITALGYEELAEALTHEQIERGMQGVRDTFDTSMTELQTAVELLTQAREKWEPILAEITALGNEAAAEMLTREQIDTGVEEEVTRFTEGISGTADRERRATESPGEMGTDTRGDQGRDLEP